jgi:hypothetical protein
MKNILSFLVVFFTTVTLSFGKAPSVSFLVGNARTTIDTVKSHNPDFQYSSVEPYASNMRQITEATGVTQQDLKKMYLKDAHNCIIIWWVVLISGILLVVSGGYAMYIDNHKYDTGPVGMIAMIFGIIFLIGSVVLCPTYLNARNNKELYVTEQMLKLLKTDNSKN